MQKDIKLVLIKIYRYENQLATAAYLSISLKKVDDNLPTRATVPSYLIHSIFPFRFWFYGIDLYTTSWFSLKGVVDDYPPKILREVQKNTPGNPVPREKIIFSNYGRSMTIYLQEQLYPPRVLIHSCSQPWSGEWHSSYLEIHICELGRFRKAQLVSIMSISTMLFWNKIAPLQNKNHPFKDNVKIDVKDQSLLHWFPIQNGRNYFCFTLSWSWRRTQPFGPSRQRQTWSRGCSTWTWCLSASCSHRRSQWGQHHMCLLKYYIVSWDNKLSESSPI